MNQDTKAWSYSALSGFELCPKKYCNSAITKQFVEPENPDGPLAYGKEVHEAFANYLTGRLQRLPTPLVHHAKFLDQLKGMSQEILVESELALDHEYQPCGWRDWNDVYVRAKVDFTGITGTEALVVDHKTGKYQEGFDQLEMQMAVVSIFRPDIEKYSGMYYWTGDRKKREILPALVRN